MEHVSKAFPITRLYACIHSAYTSKTEQNTNKMEIQIHKNITRKCLEFIAIIIIKYLQKKYRSISKKNRYRQSNRVINKLILIQAVLYYLKNEFKAWGYFHPSCVWTSKDEKKFRKLFPQKDNFEELTIVVWHNPEAVTYYHNKIFDLSKGRTPIYEKEIKKQLLKWRRWN